MKKTMLVLAVLGVVALSLGATGLAYAQTQTPQGFGPGGNGPGMANGQEGPLHDYMVTAMADVLNLQASDLESRLSDGETFYQIALSQGFTADQVPDLMDQARSQALAAAVGDGVLTQDQAEWMGQHGPMYGGGFGSGFGPCDGTGQPLGSASRSGFGPGGAARP